jgi:hypothetical protein
VEDTHTVVEVDTVAAAAGVRTGVVAVLVVVEDTHTAEVAVANIEEVAEHIVQAVVEHIVQVVVAHTLEEAAEVGIVLAAVLVVAEEDTHNRVAVVEEVDTHSLVVVEEALLHILVEVVVDMHKLVVGVGMVVEQEGNRREVELPALALEGTPCNSPQARHQQCTQMCIPPISILMMYQLSLDRK